MGGTLYTFKDEHNPHHHHHPNRRASHVHNHESHLTSGFDTELLMVGAACYQVHRCLDYYAKFNNQNITDEKMTKVLLNLPMIPMDQLERVRLDYQLHGKKFNYLS